MSHAPDQAPVAPVDEISIFPGSLTGKRIELALKSSDRHIEQNKQV
jgi:hypothetical protein